MLFWYSMAQNEAFGFILPVLQVMLQLGLTGGFFD